MRTNLVALFLLAGCSQTPDFTASIMSTPEKEFSSEKLSTEFQHGIYSYVLEWTFVDGQKFCNIIAKNAPARRSPLSLQIDGQNFRFLARRGGSIFALPQEEVDNAFAFFSEKERVTLKLFEEEKTVNCAPFHKQS